MNPDIDIEFMSRERLKKEISKLRMAIRKDRDSTDHDLCWYKPELWLLLPEKTFPNNITLPSKEEFLGKCNEYHSKVAEFIERQLFNKEPDSQESATEPIATTCEMRGNDSERKSWKERLKSFWQKMSKLI